MMRESCSSELASKQKQSCFARRNTSDPASDECSLRLTAAAVSKPRARTLDPCGG